MSVEKKKKYTQSQERASELLKALGHPARIAIIDLLANRQSCICGDITNELPLAQSTVSQHLKALKNAGIIKGEIDGVKTCYCLDENGVHELESLISPMVKNLSNSIKSCC